LAEQGLHSQTETVVRGDEVDALVWVVGVAEVIGKQMSLLYSRLI
jgi:hypothetical protein